MKLPRRSFASPKMRASPAMWSLLASAGVSLGAILIASAPAYAAPAPPMPGAASGDKQATAPAPSPLPNSKPGSQPSPLPDIRQLMTEVMDHQKQMDKVREDYTYHSAATTEDLDSKGAVTKTETEDSDVFFVNTHRIQRTVKKDGKPLSDHDQEKEQERVNKLVGKAQTTPPGEPLEGPNTTVSITHLLDIMEVSNPRREVFRGRSTIIFDFAGRRDAQTHGIAEDASKKLAGTLWVDERDRQVAHMEARFIDNFHIGGGLLANIQKGSSFYFDQALVNGEIWMPTQGEGHVEARVLLLKGYRQHFTEHDSDYHRFTVDVESTKATVVPKSKP